MADIADFLPDVLPYCPGVPDPLAERAILHAVREFCSDSGYWRGEQLFDTVTDATGTGEYTLTLAAGTDLVSVVTPIEHGVNQVHLKTEEWLRDNYAFDWRTRTNENAAYFTMKAKTIIRLVPYPTVAVVDGLRVATILGPSLIAPTVDNDVRDDWSEQIGWGALARLKAQPGQEWSDAPGSAMYRAQFDLAKDDAFTLGLAKWQSRRFQRNRTTRGYYF